MHTIVVGVDSSSASGAALAWAAARAAATGSALTVVHVVDDEWGADATELTAATRQLSTHVDAIRDDLPKLAVEGELVAGNPSVELALVAREADLLVVGTHKTGFVQGRVFGSAALRLAGEVRVPVAVIPEHSTGSRAGVVVGIDASRASDAAVRFAALEAARLGEELILVLGAGTATGPSRSMIRSERELETIARAVKVAQTTSPDVAARVRTLRRAAAPSLIDGADRAVLLVIGSSRRHVDNAVALGPVAHDVLLNITAPTVVVHPTA